MDCIVPDGAAAVGAIGHASGYFGRPTFLLLRLALAYDVHVRGSRSRLSDLALDRFGRLLASSQ